MDSVDARIIDQFTWKLVRIFVYEISDNFKLGNLGS